MVVDTAPPAKSRTVRYWEPDVPGSTPTTPRSTSCEELRRLLEDAVRLQMRSDVPRRLLPQRGHGLEPGDAAWLLAHSPRRQLQTLHRRLCRGAASSTSRATPARSRDACGAEAHTVYPTEDEFIDLLPRLVYHMDEPAAGPGLFPQYIVSRLAAQNVKVCLGGQGGRRDLRRLRALRRRLPRAGAQGRHLRDQRGRASTSSRSARSCRTCRTSRSYVPDAAAASGRRAVRADGPALLPAASTAARGRCELFSRRLPRLVTTAEAVFARFQGSSTTPTPCRTTTR